MKNIIRAAFLTTFALLLLGANASGQSQTREEVLREIETKRSELQKLEEQFLSPSAEDRSAYAEFLRQPDTGLIRLLPREVYESDTYKKNKKTITMRGGGAYYSFTRLTHEYGYGSHLGFDSGYLSVGFAGADYGILTNLGDIPVEEISLEHPGVAFIAAYHVPQTEPQVRSEARRFSLGMTIDGVRYQNRFRVEANTSYVLRSINDSETDVLVAFRVVRKDKDGSVIIAWKLLKEFPVPKMVRAN